MKLAEMTEIIKAAFTFSLIILMKLRAHLINSFIDYCSRMFWRKEGLNQINNGKSV